MSTQASFSFMAPAVPADEPSVLRIDLGKGCHAQIIVCPLDDGTWGQGSEDQFQGFCGHAFPVYPREEGYPSFRDALVVALDRLHDSWSRLMVDQSSCCTDKHRAAARKGLEWIGEQYSIHGFDPNPERLAA